MVIARPLSTDNSSRIRKKLEPSNCMVEPLSPTADRNVVAEDVDIVELWRICHKLWRFTIHVCNTPVMLLLLLVGFERRAERFWSDSPTFEFVSGRLVMQPCNETFWWEDRYIMLLSIPLSPSMQILVDKAPSFTNKIWHDQVHLQFDTVGRPN